MNKSTDGWNSLGVQSHYCRGWRHARPWPHTRTHPPPPCSLDLYSPRGIPLYVPASMFLCNTPSPPHTPAEPTPVHTFISESLPVSVSFGQCLYNLVPPPSLISPQGGVVWTLKSPFSSLFSLATLQRGGPRAVTSFSWTSLSSVCKLGLLALPSWPHRAAPAFP